MEELTGCEARNKSAAPPMSPFFQLHCRLFFPPAPSSPPPHCRYKVMAKPLNFDIKSQENVIKSLPPFFNMKEKSEVCCASRHLTFHPPTPPPPPSPLPRPFPSSSAANAHSCHPTTNCPSTSRTPTACQCSASSAPSSAPVTACAAPSRRSTSRCPASLTPAGSAAPLSACLCVVSLGCTACFCV